MMIGMLLAIIAYRPIYSKMYSLADVTAKTEIVDQRSIESSTNKNSEGVLVKTTKMIHMYDDGTRLTETDAGGKLKKEISLNGGPFYWMIAMVFIQVVFVTMVYGPIAAFLVELFPTRIRYTSMSLPYHIGNGIFGGLTPLLSVSLFELSKTEAYPGGDLLAGLWYPIAVGGICFIIGMIFLSNKKKAEVIEEG